MRFLITLLIAAATILASAGVAQARVSEPRPTANVNLTSGGWCDGWSGPLGPSAGSVKVSTRLVDSTSFDLVVDVDVRGLLANAGYSVRVGELSGLLSAPTGCYWQVAGPFLSDGRGHLKARVSVGFNKTGDRARNFQIAVGYGTGVTYVSAPFGLIVPTTPSAAAFSGL